MNKISNPAKSFLMEKLSEQDLKIFNVLNDPLAVRILVKLAMDDVSEE